jgi:hypothetical protein
MTTLKQTVIKGNKNFWEAAFKLLDEEKEKPLRKDQSYMEPIDTRYRMAMTDKYVMVFMVDHTDICKKVMRKTGHLNLADGCFGYKPFGKLIEWFSERLIVDWMVDTRVQNKR